MSLQKLRDDELSARADTLERMIHECTDHKRLPSLSRTLEAVLDEQARRDERGDSDPHL